MLAARSAEGEVARVVVAQAATDPGLAGWWLGVAIGVVVVLIVVAVVVTIIVLARRITRQAGQASAALDEACRHTDPLWELRTTNDRSRAILEGAVRAREALEDAR